MSVSDLLSKQDISFGDSPVDSNWSSWEDIYHAMDKYQQENQNVLSSNDMTYDELAASRDRIEQVTGEKIVLSRGESLKDAFSKRYDKIITQSRLEGKQEFNDISTLSEATEKAKERARQAKIDYDKAVATAAPGVWAGSASFIGGAKGWISDPVQAGATVIGAFAAPEIAASAVWRATFGRVLGKGIWSIAGAEATVNAAMEVGFQAPVVDWQKQVGHEYGWDEGLKNVMYAGAFGGGIPLMLHGVSKAFGGKGLASEFNRAIHEISRQEELNKLPRELDGAGREAFDKNLDEALTAFQEGRYPALEKLDPRASPRNFVDDAVTYEHAQVAQQILDSGVKKSEFEKSMREPYIKEKLREYLSDTNLARSDIEQIQKQLPELKRSLDEAKLAAKEAKVKMEYEGKMPVKDEKDALRVIQAESEYKKAYTREVEALRDFHRAQQDMLVTAKAIEADEFVNRLKNNEIPVALEKEYTVYKKNVKKALEEIKDKKYEADIQNLVQTYYGKQLDKKAFDEEIKQAPEIQAATSKEFDRAVVQEMDKKGFKLRVPKDDGDGMRDISLTELNDELADDESMLNVIKGCAL